MSEADQGLLRKQGEAGHTEGAPERPREAAPAPPAGRGIDFSGFDPVSGVSYSGPIFHPDATELGKQAVLAFRRDLPALLKERPGQWVAYHGPNRVGFASTDDELY